MPPPASGRGYLHGRHPTEGSCPHGKLRSAAAGGQFTTKVRVAVALFLVGVVESVRVTLTV
jgi:hypothetical protein